MCKFSPCAARIAAETGKPEGLRARGVAFGHAPTLPLILTRHVMQLDLPRAVSTLSDRPECAEVTLRTPERQRVHENLRSARFVRDGAGQGWVFEKGSRAYLFRSNAPPTRPTRQSAQLLHRQLSSDANCRTGHRCGDKRSGVGIRGCGGSQVVLEQGASGRASPDLLCAGPRAARRLHHRIGSLELDALRRPILFGMHDLPRGRSCVS